ncbi:replication-relaxation family protein [Roseovarius aestuarii]|nr:replication-relaxation family protein [Roseovarius aestuarii]
MRKPPNQIARTDSLGRRINFVRSPKGVYIHLSDRDLKTLSWQHRHGDLPTPYIHKYRYLMGYSKSPKTVCTSRRYRDFFHETKTRHNGAYIDWPFQQLQDVFRPNSSFRVHRPSKHAIEALRDADLLRLSTPASSSSWWHDFLRSCFTANIELQCLEQPDVFTFIHHDTVINNAIEKVGQAPKFQVAGETFSPDVLFGIRYNEAKKVKLFAVEIDMMTESINSEKNGNSIREKMRRYQSYIKSGAYKKEFAFGGGFFNIYLTTNYRHACNMVKNAPEEPFLLFSWVPYFVFPRRPPELMPWLFNEAYDRSGHSPFFIDRQ